MENSNFVERAIELEKLAIVEDEKHNYADAYKHYQNALDYFMLALKYEKNEEAKDLIKSKISEYLDQMEILKEHLTTGVPERDAVGINGGGDAADATGEQNLEDVQDPRVIKIMEASLMGNIMERAVELVKLAIFEDEKGNYADAYKNYRNVLNCLMIAFKCKPRRNDYITIYFTCPAEKNGKSKDLIKSKINEYLRRAETLKEYLTTERRGGSAVGGRGGATGKRNLEEMTGTPRAETKKLAGERCRL